MSIRKSLTTGDSSTKKSTAPTELGVTVDHPPAEETQADDLAADFFLKDTAPEEAHSTQVFTAAPVPAASTSRPPVRKISRLGDFRLLAELGRGGMGMVYRAQQISTGQPAAVKVLFRHLAARPALLQRFYREARILARLDHPHLLRCYEVGEDHGWHFLAVELLEGGSLEDRVKQYGPFVVGDALHVVLACAEGLGHAHGLGLVHRDIKPDNILIGTDGAIKIADLGLAKPADDDLGLTQTGTGAGTPLYMAPEQARDAKRADARSDLYALGSTLYYLLTGRPPFGGGNVVALLQAKEQGVFPPARHLNPAIPERLDVLIGKLLAKNPGQRYQICAELIEDLRRLGLANPRLSFAPTE